MTVESHLSALKQRHAALDEMLHRENKRPAPDVLTQKSLKLQKLALKEQIQRLEH